MERLRLCVVGRSDARDALATLFLRLKVTVVSELEEADVYLLLEDATEVKAAGAWVLPFGRSALAQELSPPNVLRDRWPELLEASEEALKEVLTEVLTLEQSRPSQGSSPRRDLPEPTARHKAALKRRLRRDEWNQQEILLDWAISRNPSRHVRRRFDLPALPADQSELEEYFNLLFPELELQLWDEASDEAQLLLELAMASGDRDQDGLLSVRELHYGMLCAYGYQCLTVDAARLLAFTPSTPEHLQELMETLNEGLVSVAEVKAVLREAALVGGGRRALLWALGAWYVHVQREDSDWRLILLAALRRWLPSEEEHHGRAMRDLGRMTRDLPKTLPMPKRLGGNEVTTSRAGQACVLTLAVLIHIFYFGLLIFPSCLCCFLIYLGSEHGDDRCPKDLAALLVWFGALGLAALAMDCAHDGTRLVMNLICWCLKLLLACLPLLGMAWTHLIAPEDAEVCGRTVYWTSKWLWNAMASCEMYLLLTLAWSFHVARNHERYLRKANAVD